MLGVDQYKEERRMEKEGGQILDVEKLCVLQCLSSYSRILVEFKKSITVLHMTFSNVLVNYVSNEIGLQLEMQDFSSFLYGSLSFEYLSCFGKVSSVSD